MNWLELAVAADVEAVDAIAEVFRAHGHGVAIDEPFVQPHIDEPPQLDSTRRSIVKTYLPDDPVAQEARDAIEKAVWHIAQLGTVEPLQVRSIVEEDWASAWKSFFPLLRIGRRVVVVPAWRRHRRREGEIPVRLDPGLAFGTGMHPSTRLCLVAAESLVSPGARVLDVGTGSGILGIAAARLGASEVIALDIDPIAVAAARTNVRLNRLSRVVAVFQGSPEQLFRPQPSPTLWGKSTSDMAFPEGRGQRADDGWEPRLQLLSGRKGRVVGRFAVVFSNITARVNASMAPLLASLLGWDGRLVASGILEESCDVVTDAFAAAGLRTVDLQREGDWVAITAARR